MKLAPLCVGVSLLILPAHAAETPKPPGAAPAPELTKAEIASTAEEVIEQIDTLLNESESDGPLGEKEVTALWEKRLANVDRLIADFRKRFPAHPLRWRVLFMEASAREIRQELELPIAKGSRSIVEIYTEIVDAPDADAGTKAEASSARLLALADGVSEKKTPLEEWEKKFAAHQKAFPDFEENIMLVELRLLLVEEHAPARFVPLLESLAKSTDTDVAELAQSRLSAAKAMAELKSKPLDLKFTGFDGKEVDIEKLRGKVVLVDYWATWCGPCMVQLPQLVKTYEKFKGKGFEIIGISLDEDESELKRVLKAKEITWPQYFDGKGWENPYAKKYNVEGIPAMWLVNKKGMVVDTEAEDGLEEKLEKLLGE